MLTKYVPKVSVHIVVNVLLRYNDRVYACKMMLVWNSDMINQFSEIAHLRVEGKQSTVK